MQTKSTITNSANKIREILPKKFWLLSWTPQRFREIDAPDHMKRRASP